MKKQSLAFILLTSACLTLPAFAQNTESNGRYSNNRENSVNEHQRNGGGARNTMTHGNRDSRPVVAGKITAIQGNTLTVSEHQGMMGSTTPDTLFTVDTSKAVVMKNNATSTVSALVIGDTISVQGTLTGTTVTATYIREGKLMGYKGYDENKTGMMRHKNNNQENIYTQNKNTSTFGSIKSFFSRMFSF